MDEKLIQYADHFGENFPIFIARNLSEEELIRIIDDCIANDKPYQIEVQDGVDH